MVVLVVGFSIGLRVSENNTFNKRERPIDCCEERRALHGYAIDSEQLLIYWGIICNMSIGSECTTMDIRNPVIFPRSA